MCRSLWSSVHGTSQSTRSTLAQARDAAQAGVARVPWDVVGTAGEQDLATSGLTVRCLHLGDGSLPGTDHDAGALAYVARAY